MSEYVIEHVEQLVGDVQPTRQLATLSAAEASTLSEPEFEMWLHATWRPISAQFDAGCYPDAPKLRPIATLLEGARVTPTIEPYSSDMDAVQVQVAERQSQEVSRTRAHIIKRLSAKAIEPIREGLNRVFRVNTMTPFIVDDAMAALENTYGFPTPIYRSSIDRQVYTAAFAKFNFSQEIRLRDHASLLGALAHEITYRKKTGQDLGNTPPAIAALVCDTWERVVQPFAHQPVVRQSSANIKSPEYELTQNDYGSVAHVELAA
jgi:hypothetical protein